jgi:hypothetical protein
MKDAEFELRQAIWNRLNGALAWRIYDDVPDESIPPYIEIGEADTIDASVKGRPCQQMTISFHLWSLERSWKQVTSMANDILTALTVTNSQSPSALSLTNFNIVLSKLENKRNMIDQDGLTRHGVLDILYLTQEK